MNIMKQIKMIIKKEVISFPFSNLEKGEHTISVKVWDVFNNSSEAEITFVVADENVL